jgi:mannose/fructose/N-acetylgalactosamine-specific phosphotransferase system component IID
MNKREIILEALFLACSVVISIVLSNNVDLSTLELGALVNIYTPPIVGFCSMFLYALIAWFLKENRKIVLILLISINLVVGIILHYCDF